MKRIFWGIMLLVVCTTGCSSRYQTQVEQSLLIQENQRLEDALYVTHTQLVDLKRENESLKTNQDRGTGSSSDTISPTPRLRKSQPASNDNYDDAPPYDPIKIDIPKDAHESNTLPEALKSSQTIPIPKRPTQMKTKGEQSNQGYPELILPNGNNVGGQSSPAWSPTR